MDSLRTPAPKPAPMPIGIAGQIEQILQQQLMDNATLRGWSIHIVTAPDGSLQVASGRPVTALAGWRAGWPRARCGSEGYSDVGTDGGAIT